MKQRHHLEAKKRTLLGKKVKQLRAERQVPANVFGNTQSLAITLDTKAFTTVLTEAGETGLIDLSIEGETQKRPVLVSNVAYHPLSGEILHVDLQQVNLAEKVTAHVPIEIVGESEAVKAGGVLLTMHDQIEVEALPADLPEKFILDISVLKEIGNDLKVSDLQYDKSKVEIALSLDEVLAVIQEPRKEEEVVPVSTEPVEVETTVQGKKPEGEEGTEEGKAEAKQEEK